MKIILTYSGKGGVGKSTTSANLARLLSKTCKVYLLDLDVNTPSIHSIFKDKNYSENLLINSMGYKTENLVYVQGSLIKSYMNDSIKEMNKWDPEYVIVDTPPSISDVHINIIEKLNISGLLLVTQPTTLSIEDVKRTSKFFMARNIYTIGILQNMVGKHFGDAVDTQKLLNIETIAEVPLDKQYSEKILTSDLKPYEPILPLIKNIDNVTLKVKIKTIIDNTMDWKELRKEIHAKLVPPYKAKSSEIWYFRNLETWDWLKEEMDERVPHSIFGYDMFLMYQTVENLERLVKAFEIEDSAYFMVTRSPSVEIPLFPGEIGEATFFITRESYYGVPRIKYRTKHGQVTLFAHEVIPMTPEDIQLYVNEGYKLMSDGRYIPTKDHLWEVYHAFGNRIGLFDNWEKKYDKEYPHLALENKVKNI